MGETISNAVGKLIKSQQGTVSYTDNGKDVVVTSKPAHYSMKIELIDKQARKEKKASVRLSKTYTYPKEIEGAVLWDMLLTMRETILGLPECHDAWNNSFGKSWRQLYIDETIENVSRSGKWADSNYANAYIAGYKRGERKHKADDTVTDLPTTDPDTTPGTVQGAQV